VRQSRGDAGLTRHEHTRGAGRDREEHTGAESQEESGGHEEIRLGENQAESPGDEGIHKEEHETVERDSHLSSVAVHELDAATGSGEKHTGAER